MNHITKTVLASDGC